MAKESLISHPKFLRLVRLLKCSRAQALGHLELLYLSAHGRACARFANVDELEAVADWTGKRGALVSALRAVHLLDKGRGHALDLHDYWDHCPDYVIKRAKRAGTLPGAVRRRTAPDGDTRRPTDPDPDPDRSMTADPDPVRSMPKPGSASTVHARPGGGGNTPKRGQGGPQAAAGAILEAMTALGDGRKPPSGPEDRPDWGAMTARELADYCARYEGKANQASAKNLWRSRVAALEAHPDGLEFLRKSLAHIDHERRHAARTGGTPIHSPAKWLNKTTADFLLKTKAGAK